MKHQEPDLRNILKEIIKPELHSNIEDWLFDAKVQEKKGLYLISKIILNKGNSVFNDHSSEVKENDINEVTFKAATERHKRKTVNSTYKTDFVSSTKFLYKNIFQYRDLLETNYTEILNPLSVQYIRNWLKLEKCENYKELVLLFLRAFYATIRSNRKFVTIKQNDYNEYKKHELYSKEPFFTEKQGEKKASQYPTTEELRKILKIDEMKEKLSKIPPITYNDNLENQEFILKKKQELVRGKKNLLKGIYGDTTTSIYQESFKGHPEKFKYYFKPDMFTSGVKGKIPDPYMMTRVNGHFQIDDNLSKRVKSII